VAYQVQRRLDELGEAVPEHDRARAELLISDARAALEEQAPIDRLRALTGELHQMSQVLTTSTPGGGRGAAGAESGATGGSGSDSDADDVIDAEFTTH
jgi:molecular chaperone DnaK